MRQRSVLWLAPPRARRGDIGGTAVELVVGAEARLREGPDEREPEERRDERRERIVLQQAPEPVRHVRVADAGLHGHVAARST